jgi:hypothetical protein
MSHHFSIDADKKYFTVEEANKMLPLIRAIMSDVVETFREVNERRERLALVKGDSDSAPRDPYREELEQIEEELEKDIEQLQVYVDELRALGVEPKNFVMGLVDFPAWINGHEAYLCWHLDEPDVLYWHELDAGYAGRQSVANLAKSEKHKTVVGQ